MQYYRATVAYDGTDFLGFQLQVARNRSTDLGDRALPGTIRTVQGVLEEALLGLTGAAVPVVASGRTDAGVHAVGQVVGFRAPWRHAIHDLHRALNAVLPSDVAVVDLMPAAADWHPRFSAWRRHYRYTVLNTPWRDPLARRYALHLARPLQLERLQAAAGLFVGEHDFASFGRPMQDGESTVRAVFNSDWRDDGKVFTYDVVGNAFLRGMVRSLVGSMLQVGMGEWSVEQLAEVLAARDRSLAARPADACGLCLMHVEYDVPQS